MYIRDELGNHLPVPERIPAEILEPRVAFEFTGTFMVADSVLWFSLETFVDEVCGLDGPAFGYFVPLNLDLFAKDLFSDFTSASTDVGSTTLHALVSNDTNGEIIGC